MPKNHHKKTGEIQQLLIERSKKTNRAKVGDKIFQIYALGNEEVELGNSELKTYERIMTAVGMLSKIHWTRPRIAQALCEIYDIPIGNIAVCYRYIRIAEDIFGEMHQLKKATTKILLHQEATKLLKQLKTQYQKTDKPEYSDQILRTLEFLRKLHEVNQADEEIIDPELLRLPPISLVNDVHALNAYKKSINLDIIDVEEITEE